MIALARAPRARVADNSNTRDGNLAHNRLFSSFRRHVLAQGAMAMAALV
jgi:hypothetical protein